MAARGEWCATGGGLRDVGRRHCFSQRRSHLNHADRVAVGIRRWQGGRRRRDRTGHLTDQHCQRPLPARPRDSIRPSLRDSTRGAPRGEHRPHRRGERQSVPSLASVGQRESRAVPARGRRPSGQPGPIVRGGAPLRRAVPRVAGTDRPPAGAITASRGDARYRSAAQLSGRRPGSLGPPVRRGHRGRTSSGPRASPSVACLEAPTRRALPMTSKHVALHWSSMPGRPLRRYDP